MGARATAMAFLACSPATLAVLGGTTEQLNHRANPDSYPVHGEAAMAVTQISGIQAAKSAAAMIPRCQPIPLHSIDVDVDIVEGGVAITSVVDAAAGNDVEMQALTAAGVAALTLYDLVRDADRTARVTSIRTVDKSEGLVPAATVAEIQAIPVAPEPLPLTGADIPAEVVSSVALVITVSDQPADESATSTAGELIAARLAELGIATGQALVPHESAAIAAAISQGVCDGVGLVITTGGTGVGPRDVTPQATAPLLTLTLDRLADALAAADDTYAPRALLSRGVAGLAGRTVVINLPGSVTAVAQCMTYLADVLPQLLEHVSNDTEAPQRDAS